MVRLVILYPGDIQQDFLVYQQAAFFFLFYSYTTFQIYGFYPA